MDYIKFVVEVVQSANHAFRHVSDSLLAVVLIELLHFGLQNLVHIPGLQAMVRYELLNFAVKRHAFAIVGYVHYEIEFVTLRTVDDFLDLNNVRVVQLLEDLDFLVDLIQSSGEGHPLSFEETLIAMTRTKLSLFLQIRFEEDLDCLQ